ncbi:hypothetical protein [Isoptericola jiangsuensis]|uniref:hypothetical protein n=1 Tax=Isoptericola jiangsuensis TaxID=548579 RepID=UPI000BF5B4FF|nr:hypothetical protein [Isoptericola jiangsuensis]
MSTTETARDDDLVGAQRHAQTTVYSTSGRSLVAELCPQAAARPTATQRRRTTARAVARFLHACIDAAPRDDVTERSQQIPEYREAKDEMLRYHLLRQLR